MPEKGRKIGYHAVMLVWFSRSLSLTSLLDRWRTAPASFQPDQPVDSTWYVDGYTAALGDSNDQDLFARAVSRLFSFRIFPDALLQFSADFVQENRPPAFGDRVVQRIRVIPYLLDAVVLCAVTSVWHETDRRGFTMVTTGKHFGMGEWTATISRKPGGQIQFMMHIICKPGNRFPRFSDGFIRRVLIRTHRSAPEYFRDSVVNSETEGGI